MNRSVDGGSPPVPRMISLTRVAWLTYAALFAVIGVPLLWQGTQDQWSGSSWTALSVLTWGGQSLLWVSWLGLLGMGSMMTSGLATGLPEQVVAALVISFVYGSLQFVVLLTLYKVVRLLVKHVRAAQRRWASRRYGVPTSDDS